MKLSLALALNLALLATAAPTALHSKRADGQEVSPEAELAQKIAYGSLKSAAEMMNINSKDTNSEDADFGNNMPVTMTPNDMASFPDADGSGPKKPKAKKPKAKKPNKPTPVRGEDDKELEDEVDEKVSKPTPSPSSSAKPKASSTAASTDDEAEEEERGLKKQPAAETAEEAEAEPTKAAAEKPAPKPKDDNPLSKIPLIGTLVGGGGPLGGL
ncbi:hypothetical protein ASPCAL03709 [Aspergillus calidoustus]|uniref:Uncharacterized protein n=1 Tax=Aspergillus calidoustus TaxID=454130 RepID=A0A0U5C438_ASPCI|nr:hypothetical protein ASPCAL03709 [Aspergillus calidoustus]